MKNVPDPFFGPLFRALGSGSTQKNQPRRWSPSEPDFVFQAFDRVLGKLSLTPFLALGKVCRETVPDTFSQHAEWIRAAREGLCQGTAAARHPSGKPVVEQQEQHHADDEADGPWGFG